MKFVFPAPTRQKKIQTRFIFHLRIDSIVQEHTSLPYKRDSDFVFIQLKNLSQKAIKKASRYIIMDIRWLPKESAMGRRVLCGAKIH